jgi:hypothetical protein
MIQFFSDPSSTFSNIIHLHHEHFLVYYQPLSSSIFSTIGLTQPVCPVPNSFHFTLKTSDTISDGAPEEDWG